MRREIRETLLNAVRTARFVSGRKGALHGIEHALNSASRTEGKKRLEVVQEVVLSDRSVSVRRSAYLILRSGHWWGSDGSVQLHTDAKRFGRWLKYPPPAPKLGMPAHRNAEFKGFTQGGCSGQRGPCDYFPRCHSRYASLFPIPRSLATFLSAAFSSAFSSDMISRTRWATVALSAMD
jgi:hypothetical protein